MIFIPGRILFYWVVVHTLQRIIQVPYNDKVYTTTYLNSHYIVFGWFWLWYVLQRFLFVKVFWCPCMAIYVVNVQYNGGLLPDIVDPMLLPSSGNPFKCHDEVLFLQPIYDPM